MGIVGLSLLFLSATQSYNLPTGLLSALCYVESTHKIDAVHYDDGTDNSLGVCQIQLKTAKFLKFKGSEKDLMKPKNNVLYAAKYLNYQLKRYNGDVFKAIASYNAGSYIVNNKFEPVNNYYVKKVLKAWSKEK